MRSSSWLASHQIALWRNGERFFPSQIPHIEITQEQLKLWGLANRQILPLGMAMMGTVKERLVRMKSLV
jgi:hypothetical protein